MQDTPVRDSLLPPGGQTDREVLQDQGGAQQDPQDGLRCGFRLGEMGPEDIMIDFHISLLALQINLARLKFPFENIILAAVMNFCLMMIWFTLVYLSTLEKESTDR